jgi:hypothetical protein
MLEEQENEDSLEVDVEETIQDQLEVQEEAVEKVTDEPEEESQEEEEEVFITIGDEEPEPKEEEPKSSGLVNKLRKMDREKAKRIKELEKQINGNTEKKPVVLAKRPSLEDYGYDEPKHDKAVDEWYETKRQFDKQEAAKKEASETQAKEWQSTKESYNTLKTELKVKDFDDYEEIVTDKLSIEKQNIILAGAKNPARLVYALGNNPKKLEELSKLSDIKYAFAIAELEGQIKMGKRKPKTTPERKLNGSGGASGVKNSNLEKLWDKCAEKGDFTEYHKAKRAKRKE